MSIIRHRVYAHDTVLKIPPRKGQDDRELLRSIGRRVTNIVLDAKTETISEKTDQIESRLAQMKSKLLEEVTT